MSKTYSFASAEIFQEVMLKVQAEQQVGASIASSQTITFKGVLL
jgi:hypothetical protein